MNIKFQALNDELAKTTSTKEFIETLVDGVCAAFISVANEETRVKFLASELLRDRSQFSISLPLDPPSTTVLVGSDLTDEEKVKQVANNSVLLALLFKLLNSPTEPANG